MKAALTASAGSQNVALGDVHAFRKKDNATALKYYNQALTYQKVADKQKAAVKEKIAKFSK